MTGWGNVPRLASVAAVPEFCQPRCSAISPEDISSFASIASDVPLDIATEYGVPPAPGSNVE